MSAALFWLLAKTVSALLEPLTFEEWISSRCEPVVIRRRM